MTKVTALLPEKMDYDERAFADERFQGDFMNVTLEIVSYESDSVLRVIVLIKNLYISCNIL